MSSHQVLHTKLVDGYLSFQKQAYSPFHVVDWSKNLLLEGGFEFLDLRSPWNLEVGGRYGVVHSCGKALIAFQVGNSPPWKSEGGLGLVVAHVDSPCLRLKMDPYHKKDGLSLFLTQTHGHLIFRSWLDRPLALGGAVYWERPELSSLCPNLKQELVHSPHPVGVIPDLAIHLDQEKNHQGAINPETFLNVIVGKKDRENFLKDALGLGGSKDHLRGFELSLSVAEASKVVGVHKELLLSPRHDDLAMVFSAAKAFVGAVASQQTPVLGLFDGEESGSMTAGGAMGSFMDFVTEKLAKSWPGESPSPERGEFWSQGFCLSADVAHGLHPGALDKSEQAHAPRLGGGIVLKENANDRYGTSGASRALVESLCERHHIPLQKFISRQDLACGSTIGPMIHARFGIPTADVGIAVLAMHSSVETMATEDLDHGVHFFQNFWELHPRNFSCL